MADSLKTIRADMNALKRKRRKERWQRRFLNALSWVFFVKCGDCGRWFSWNAKTVLRHIPHDGTYVAHKVCP